ncbi:MAG: FAD-dependent oxidoreductase, partial [Burkholderiaceae bacterium]
MSPDTYYAASAGPAPAPRTLRGRADTEVCIVGAGFAGLATAIGLIERGVGDVVVVDAATVGHGASGRNGGFVLGGFSLDPGRLLLQQGPERAREMVGLTRAAVDTIRRRIVRHEIACDRVEAGVVLANWFDDDAILHRRRELMARHFDVHCRYLSHDDLGAYTRSPRYAGGLLEADAFHFHPLKYARGLARAIEAGGGRIFEQTPVARIVERAAAGRAPDAASRPGSRGFDVHTQGPDGATAVLHARHVVIAGGGYLRGLSPPLERAMLPIATYVMATEPLGDELARSIPGQAAIYDTRFSFDYYRPLPDTRLLWGGRNSILRRGAASIARLLKADLGKVYPELRDVKVEYAWGGLMSYARHEMPQIGRLGDGTWHALGFGGHGVSPTTAGGELIAAAIAHGQPIPAGFADYGLSRTWGGAGLVAAQAKCNWLEFK